MGPETKSHTPEETPHRELKRNSAGGYYGGDCVTTVLEKQRGYLRGQIPLKPASNAILFLWLLFFVN